MKTREIETVITRRIRFSEKKFWLTSNAIKSSYKSDFIGPWSNTLYLHFTKEDFPMIKSPPLIDAFYGSGKRFNYADSALNELDFHGGITFYEESYLPDADKTFVKVGCDYQHYMDDHYQEEDNGEEILKNDGMLLVSQFEELVKKLSVPTEILPDDQGLNRKKENT